MTIEELFTKYPDLDNPAVAGVEFYQAIATGEGDNEDLEVITSLYADAGETVPSGYDEKLKPGTYLLSFPDYARNLEFATVDDIDAHLQANKGKFKLPGYSYSE